MVVELLQNGAVLWEIALRIQFCQQWLRCHLSKQNPIFTDNTWLFEIDKIITSDDDDIGQDDDQKPVSLVGGNRRLVAN